ncbi:hypothetical protein SNOG_13810 [Parastagonospora nodorum SN15]|uniref:Uncharacterized protein n=1 Tax=Phaeosphaeria nodorum (strain SN15 / ATCC MYA-4574 / FGSC 10173) TaxID=321614 RepID=Q0U354_PHANO|nr:hypothetical protein SNOG_13810 [Parastagonospora nodorum SN15]EAT78834.1 hypothetical protein SNOG_13810 [Parastagonospora nodorum SN15]
MSLLPGDREASESQKTQDNRLKLVHRGTFVAQ